MSEHKPKPYEKGRLEEYFSEPWESRQSEIDETRKKYPKDFITRDREVKQAKRLFAKHLKQLRVGGVYTNEELVANIFDLRLEEGLGDYFDEFTKWEDAEGGRRLTELRQPAPDDDRFITVDSEDGNGDKPEEDPGQETAKLQEPAGLYPNLSETQSKIYQFLKENNPVGEELELTKINFPPFVNNRHKSTYIKVLQKHGYIKFCKRENLESSYKILSHENSPGH